jgi:O-antigen/teichoic acid export membrane protein
MTEQELDALLSSALPERDAAEFSVALMERIAHHQARPARILSWLMIGVLVIVIAAACAFGAAAAGRAHLGMPVLAIPCALTLLTLILSFAVTQSARE